MKPSVRRLGVLSRHLASSNGAANARLTSRADFTRANVMAALDHHGYCILERYVDDPAALRRDFDNTLLPRTPTGRNRFEGSKTRRCYSLFAKTRVFDTLACDPLLLDCVEAALGSEHFLLSSTVGISIGPGEIAQPLHRDDGKYPVARPHPEMVLNCIVAIDDFSAENGGTRIFPGSHRWQYSGENEYATRTVLPSTFARASGNSLNAKAAIPQLDSAHSVGVTMPKGSIMIYRGSLLHGGGANMSSRPRLGVLLEYVSAWLRPQENHVIAVNRATVKKLPVRLQELLGWTVTPPFLGYVDGRHPRRFLDSDE
jgi:ectoine hydroxylase-related dioxygenase (phytanoyl-CoA dioxygenase family)